MGHYPTPTIGMEFMGRNGIGVHDYLEGRGEGNGILYTCSAGHIDLAHVRAGADWTWYASHIVREKISNKTELIAFVTNVDPSIFHLEITYPHGWEVLSPGEQDETASAVSIILGQYLILQVANWHEILTWYGFRYFDPFPEFPSAFSWEDNFSNMMGIHLAGTVLMRMKDWHQTFDWYNATMTEAMRDELDAFNVLTKNESIQVTRQVKEEWYEGWVPGFMNIHARNFDAGYGDGYISPMVLDRVNMCEEAAFAGYPVPTLAGLEKYGFKVVVRIEPNVIIQKRILRVIQQRQETKVIFIDVENHFPLIFDDILQKAEDLKMKFIRP